jgi:hypothetical protein
MGERRGKKAKKTGWHLQVGLKELIFVGLGVAGLVMMSFALGTLAGRGDIYRVMANWGLLAPDSGRAFQSWQQAPVSTPVAAPANPAPQESPAAEEPEPPQSTAAEKTPAPAPVKGHIAAPPNPVKTPKKTPPPQAKTKQDKLEKIRREVATKLKFQNSLDLSASRTSTSGDKKKKDEAKETKAASKPSTSQVMVAKYREAGRARVRMAQMQKQGEKVYLKEGKDAEGKFFVIYRLVSTSPAKSPQAAQSHVKKPDPPKKAAQSGGR